MQAKAKRAVLIASSLIVAGLIGLSFSKPGRIQYHKWRAIAAKREYHRLLRGEYRFSDTLRELLLAKPLSTAKVLSTWKSHEQALIDVGYLERVEYYARRGKVPPIGDPEFAAVRQQMDRVCPCWSYAVSQSGSSMTVAATKEGFQLWKKLAPTVGLQEEKPTKQRCNRRKKSDRLTLTSQFNASPRKAASKP